MKLIALKNFRNVGGRIKIANALNENHVHKGAVFEIGKSDTHTELKDENNDDANLVRLLDLSQCIGDANNKELVKRVQAELAEEKALEERQAKAIAKNA